MESKKTRFLALLLTVVLMMSVFATTAFAAEAADDLVCYTHGDVDGDGQIGTQDAIYVLYHVFYNEVFPDLYPVSQNCDFNGDEALGTDDAIYVLYASFGIYEDYKLKGVVHEYFDPIWTWDTSKDVPEVSVTFSCACGKPLTYTGENGVTVTAGTVTEATCVKAGQKTYTAEVTHADAVYSDECVVTIPASGDGHDLVGTQSCTEGVICKNCDYELPALGHSLKLNAEKSTAATCQAQAVQHYDCANCDYTEQVTLEGTLGHAYAYLQDVLKAGTSCTYVKQYKCASCGEVVDGAADSDTYEKHVYTAELTKEANCTEAGVKTYACSVEGCTESYTEPVVTNGVHVWNEGVTSGNVTTHTCTKCDETKETITVSADTAVKKEELASKEMQLENGAALSMDESAAASLEEGREVNISVTPANKAEIGLTAAQLEQLAGITVYDFSMRYTDDNSAVTDFGGGEVTISLPYELQAGDDVDSIDVWYIDDNGNLEQLKGVYSNGYVTFTTKHFSYYTVTRLTPAERCARYGHIIVSTEKLPTCTEDGYSMSYCQRCGVQQSKTVAAMTGHNYQTVVAESKDATCSEKGKLVETCANCRDRRSSDIPALGHDMQLDEANSSVATCNAPGQTVQVCARGCGHTVVEEHAQLEHDFQLKNEKKADCTNQGHKKYECSLCGATQETDKEAPTGHDYKAENAVWSWNEDNSVATVTLVCAHNEKHTKEVKAVVTVTEKAAACLASGEITYTATASFNNATFTDVRKESTPSVGHKPGETWEHNSKQHYRVCTVCKEAVDAVSHNMGDTVVIQAPTCADSGSGTATCAVCGYEKQVTIPATGEHSFVNGICGGCGLDENACNHKVARNKIPVDLSAYGACEGSEMYYMSCDCGEYKYLMGDLKCNLEYIPVDETPEGYYMVFNYVCTECGLEFQEGYIPYIIEDKCTVYEATTIKAFANGECIAEGTRIDWGWASEHPLKTEKTKVDLADYGLCGGILEIRSCYCGERTYVEEMGAEKGEPCVWGEFNEETMRSTCEVCGAERLFEILEKEEDPCTFGSSYKLAFYVGGKEVISCIGGELWEMHTYDIVDYELYGDSCEDGVYVIKVCALCGKQNDAYVEYHNTLVNTRTDLSDTGFCYDKQVDATCPCGEYVYTRFERSENDGMDHVWTLGEDGLWRCDYCGYAITEEYEYGEKNEYCEMQVVKRTIYTHKNGNTIVALDSTRETQHNIEFTFELLGDNCTDGYVRTEACTDCEYSYRSEYDGHNMYRVEEFDISSLGSCTPIIGKVTCPCGKETGVGWSGGPNGSCNWNYYYDDETGVYYRCEKCGLIWTESEEVLEQIDDCHARISTTVTLRNEAGETLEYTYEYVRNMHQTLCTFELNNPDGTCYDGYTVFETCERCGYQDTFRSSWHEVFPVARQTITDENMCGTLEMVTYSCACGANSWTDQEWTGGECWFAYGKWDEELNIHVVYCEYCGTKRAEQTKRLNTETDHPCKYQVKEITSFYSQDNKLLGSVESVYWNWDHDADLSYELLDPEAGCDGGYRIYGNCKTCGEEMYDSESVHYGHSNRQISSQILLKNNGDFCSDVKYVTHGCACGYYGGTGMWFHCEFTERYTDKDGWHIETCRNCGLEKREKGNEIRDPETCMASVEIDFAFYLDGELLNEAHVSSVFESHNVWMIPTLLNPEGTCDDGYYVTETCENCGKVFETSGVMYGHETWYREYRLESYGKCSGYVDVESCACGQEVHVYYWAGCGNNLGTDPETGMNKRYCADCGITTYYMEESEFDAQTCTRSGTFRMKLVDAEGNVLYNEEIPFCNEEHTWVHTMTLVNPEGDCEDGYYVSCTCYYCGRTEERGREYGHSTWTVELINLADYGSECGGIVEIHRCACGERNAYMTTDESRHSFQRKNWSEADENGVNHKFETRTCVDCGLAITEEEYDNWSAEVCYYERTHLTTYRLNGLERTVKRVETHANHDAQETRTELRPGASSCDEGAYVYWTCQKCGEVGRYETEGHNTCNRVEQDSIDLATYGSNCGATLVHYVCACGEHQRYDFAPDSQCDLDHQWIENFVPGSIDAWQYTTNGYTETDSQSYIIACALTDPDCDLVIRMSEYWLNENCMAVEYQRWELGYNRETGEYAYAFTIPTGERHAYHPYETSNVYEELSESSYISGTFYDCPDCDSYYSTARMYENGDAVWYEDKAYNDPALNNGEPSEWLHMQKYDYVYGGYRFRTLEYVQRTYLDGSVSFDRWEYTYDHSNGCRRTCVYTTSGGHYSSYQDEAHAGRSGWEWIYERTCSQFGIERYTYGCVICGIIYNTYDDVYDPYAHDWGYNGECYYCYRCGLESQNGASGVIVMEDMTESHGNGENYVIGYWNREDLEFMPVLSVVLYDSEAEDNILILNGVDFIDMNREKDGIVAMAFNYEATQAAANAAIAEAGYEGSYAIRINFVPINGDDSLEYAITFDTQVTAQ